MFTFFTTFIALVRLLITERISVELGKPWKDVTRHKNVYCGAQPPEFSSEENSSLRQDGYDVELKL